VNLAAPLVELVKSPALERTYLALPAPGTSLPLPGLFCFMCKPSPLERQAAAESHWLDFVGGLREKKRGVAWRIEVPRCGGGAPPWTATWATAEGATVFSLALQAPDGVAPPSIGTVAASVGGTFTLPVGADNVQLDVAFNGAGVFVWPSGSFGATGAAVAGGGSCGGGGGLGGGNAASSGGDGGGGGGGGGGGAGKIFLLRGSGNGGKGLRVDLVAGKGLRVDLVAAASERERAAHATYTGPRNTNGTPKLSTVEGKAWAAQQRREAIVRAGGGLPTGSQMVAEVGAPPPPPSPFHIYLPPTLH
jgi:hypothetical protein